MKTMVKNVRLSYVKVFEATQVNGQGDFNYSVLLLIDKKSEAAEKLKAAIKAEYEALPQRYPKLAGKLPKVWNNPLRDGDEERDGSEYEGMYFMNAKRKAKQGAPIVIDGRKQYITDPNELYSGCYGNVSVSVHGYEHTGKYGVGIGLNAIQKAADGERLDGGASIDDFDTLEDNDDLFN